MMALGGFAWVIGQQWMNDQAQETGARQAPESELTASGTDPGAPISLLPREPGGVTILEKQAEPPGENNMAALAPVAQGAEAASGFAMDLGNADSFLELTRRFVSIAEINGAENFLRLEPRAVLRETVDGLEARLLVGPFRTQSAAEDACSVLILDPDTPCLAAPFEGELIPRQ